MNLYQVEIENGHLTVFWKISEIGSSAPQGAYWLNRLTNIPLSGLITAESDDEAWQVVSSYYKSKAGKELVRK